MVKWVLRRSSGTDNPHATDLKMGAAFDPIVSSLYAIDYDLFPEFLTVVSQSENWGFSKASFRFHENMDQHELAQVSAVSGRKMKPGEVLIMEEQAGAVLLDSASFFRLVFDYGSALLANKASRDLVANEWKADMHRALALIAARLQS
ncbi:hypothetical protein [Chitinophaga sp. Cy-1792]|uniref:hypothetical protein n=1 Tax=Chitinophaga sp. Cy-1792 TaxID=2608339 RepID=UPI0014236BBC|nr:hypothetical protein [Chitinophaga sp. Cy-1792]NIG56007.1 hypothetical protein [Chitinophaga sp. Cy-1792]